MHHLVTDGTTERKWRNMLRDIPPYTDFETVDRHNPASRLTAALF
jgi:hypothetical protein